MAAGGQGRDGQLPRLMATIHSTRSTPIYALAVQGCWSCMLLIPSNFEQLLNYFGIVSWLFYGLSGGEQCCFDGSAVTDSVHAATVALIVMRHKDPDHQRPYKALTPASA